MSHPLPPSQPHPGQRLDKAPSPREGYPRTPEHEQLEEQLHHDRSGERGGTQADAPASASGDRNEGEGNRTAARHYDEKATEAAKDGAKVDSLAEEAERAIDSSEAETLRNAELRGKLQQHH